MAAHRVVRICNLFFSNQALSQKEDISDSSEVQPAETAGNEAPSTPEDKGESVVDLEASARQVPRSGRLC
jgi:hypothetical protein